MSGMFCSALIAPGNAGQAERGTARLNRSRRAGGQRGARRFAAELSALLAPRAIEHHGSR